MGVAVGGRHALHFIAHNAGLLTLDGPDDCGELSLDTRGIDPAKLLEPEGMLLGEEILAGAIAPRPGNFHKGQAGSVGILGGAAGMDRGPVTPRRPSLNGAPGRRTLGQPNPPCASTDTHGAVPRAPK